ncbi:MAG: ParA family protein [Rhodocyclaceae bacterium]|nr:ParA family protein [Rhodocyclaceae bacterium]
METSIVTVANQKGGVGKTTTVVNLASAYAQTDKRVLVVDMDYQGNATSLLGIDSEQLDPTKTIPHALENDLTLADIRLPTNVPGVDLLASTRGLDALRDKFQGQPNQFKLVELLLECDEREEYDVIIIDTHPSLDCFFQSAMAASHYYLIPLFAEADPSRGLGHMVTAVEKIRRYLNPMLTFLGCVITRFDKSNATHAKFETVIRESSKGAKFHVFNTMIPSSNTVAAASAQSLPLSKYKKSAPASIAYATLAGEILPLLKGKRTGRKMAPNNVAILDAAMTDLEGTVEL